MAVILMDGFDLYANKADVIAAGWGSEHVSNIDFSTTLGRFGGGCLTSTGGSSGWVTGLDLVGGDTLHIACSCYLNLTGGGASDVLIQGKNVDNENIFRLDINASGDLKAINAAGVQVGSTSLAAFTDDSWHWLEIRVVIGTTDTNGTIEVRVNDVVKINVSSIDTFGLNSGGIGSLTFLGSSGDTRFDDIILMDTTGTGMNGFLTDSKITTLIPNGDGVTVNWAASAGLDYQCVDDGIGGSNDDTDYISSSTVAQITELTMSNLPDNPSTIHGVQMRHRSRKTDAGARTYRSFLKSGGSTGNGTTMGVTIGYAWRFGGVVTRNPNGTILWSKAAINALICGVEVVS